MKINLTLTILARMLPVALSILLLAAPAQSEAASPPHVFTVTAATPGDVTINSPLCNANPTAVILVTQNLSPNQVINNHPIGVFYDTLTKKWLIYNEDFTTIPAGATFNVKVEKTATAKNFRLITSGDNSSEDFTEIPSNGLNGKTNALFLVNHLFNPNKARLDLGVYQTNNLGIWYDGSHWAVYTENQSTPLATSYNISNITGQTNASLLLTSVTNTSNLFTNDVVIDNPICNGNSNAIIFVAHNYLTTNVSSVSGYDTLHDHPLGVFYLSGSWAIFNLDGAKMNTNVAFDIQVYPGTN